MDAENFKRKFLSFHPKLFRIAYALVENKAVGSSTATDPGAFRVVLKPQNQKYDVATPTEKVTVADPANVTEAELAKIKEKVQLEYSQNNDDANLADQKGTPADKTNKIQSVTKDADGNLVVTYTDGSQIRYHYQNL